MAIATRLDRLEVRAAAVELPATGSRLACYRDDPVSFVQECFTWRPGENPTEYQEDVLRRLVSHRRIAVRGPHGLGKTTIAAWAILWFALTRDGEDWKIATTASAWRQLTHFLWPEVRKWSRRLRWDRLEREPFDPRTELQTLGLKLSTGEAFAVASDTPELIEGAHADHLFYVFDESKTIPAGTWDAAEGAFSGAGSDTGAEAFALAISTPGEPQGRFYEIHKHAPGFEDWTSRHVTLAETVAAGRVSSDWAAQRALQWGEQSAVYQNRVLGEFAASDEDGIVPLAWIEAANERWRTWTESGKTIDQLTSVGVDPARGGGDKTVLALRSEWVITELRRYAQADTMSTAGHVAGVLSAQRGRAIVDVIGIGAGVFDRLREQRFQVSAFNASEHTDDLDRTRELGFANRRAAGWWKLRELLDPANGVRLSLPPDDLLTGDLTAPHWRVTSSGKIQVESKDDIRQRLGRSTDDGDAVMMAFYDPGEAARTTAKGLAEMIRNGQAFTVKTGLEQTPTEQDRKDFMGMFNR